MKIISIFIYTIFLLYWGLRNRQKHIEEIKKSYYKTKLKDKMLITIFIINFFFLYLNSYKSIDLIIYITFGIFTGLVIGIIEIKKYIKNSEIYIREKNIILSPLTILFFIIWILAVINIYLSIRLINKFILFVPLLGMLIFVSSLIQYIYIVKYKETI